MYILSSFTTPELAQVEVNRVAEEIRRYKSGELDEETFRKFRLENGVYGIRFQKDIQMIRVKVPYGLLTAEQMERLGEVADIFANGIGHVTTRQDFQFHWVPLEVVPELLRRINEVGLTTREACGNTVRNVTACPIAGVSPDEIFNITPYADTIVRYFLRNPLNQNLPRKFKIALEGCQTDHAATGMHDIGILADREIVNGKELKGFKIYVGGGLGPPPFAAQLLEEFTPADQLLVTCEAILRVFDRLGERGNPARARIKFVIMRLGMAEFRKIVLKERIAVYATRAGDRLWKIREFEEEPPPSFPTPSDRVESSPEFERWRRTNVFNQRQKGFYYVYVTLPAGDITTQQFYALASMARKYSGGILVTTRTQNLVFKWIREDLLYDFYVDLNAAGLATYGANRILSVVGCPGADTCNLAITHSHRLALELHRRLKEMPEIVMAEDLKDISIKVSGCPNACGQHHIADIGFYGSANRVDGKMAPYYTLLLGGGIGPGKAIFGTPVAKVPAKNVPDVVLRLIQLYRENRKDGESFSEWVKRSQEEMGGEGLHGEVAVASKGGEK
jgi:sulfite reductase beta subunit-like hemoprotein